MAIAHDGLANGLAKEAVLEQPVPLNLNDEQVRFFGRGIGSSSRKGVTEHVERVQRDALSVAPYRCILTYSFLDFRTATLPAYHDAIALGRERPDALYLDCGCFVGTDVRKAIEDGWPPDRILGTDLEAGFIRVGRQLFNEALSATQPAFLAGDLFSDDFLDEHVQTGDSELPVLSRLTSLTPLRERCAVINCGSLFHLFDEETQERLAQRVLSLLSRQPGSIILGGQVGASEGAEGLSSRHLRPGERYIHSPTSWKAMWAAIDDNLECRAELAEWPRAIDTAGRLVWSVSRK